GSQRVFRQRHRRGLKTILREDRGGVRAVGRDDQAEVGTLLANAGANAGGEEPFWEFHCSNSSALRAASRTRFGAVPPTVFFFDRIISMLLNERARSRPTISCACRNGIPFAASSSAASVASSSGEVAASRMRSE